MSVVPLRKPFLKVVGSVPYKSPDQIAFEEAVTRKDAHTWLATQRLGYFNVQSLHQHLILGHANSQPFLTSNPVTQIQLSAFEPDSADVEKALEDSAFYYTLLKVSSERKTGLPSAYRKALESKNGYAPILRQQLGEYRLGR